MNTLKLVDLKIDVRGFGDEPISLGDLEGNRFEIVVRNVNNKPRKVDRVKNYFGEQRFGRNNAEIGKLIIKRKFREAVELISKGEGNYERQVREYMNFSERDYIGALRSIPKKIVMFFIHAYQSKLWNEMAEKSEKDVPIIGFGTEETDAIRIILNREGIGIRDFIIREIPELSAEGGKRDLYVKVNNLVIGELEGDELNPGMKKCRVSFSLGKGSYGTEVVKELFKNC